MSHGTTAALPPAGWYPAAHANHELRYWDGSRWLESAAAPHAEQPDSAPASAPTHPRPDGPDTAFPWWGWVLAGVAAMIVAIGLVWFFNRDSSVAPDSAPSPAATQEDEGPADAAPEPEEEPEAESEEEPDYPGAVREEFSGSGDTVIPIDIVGPATVAFTCENCSGNIVVTADGTDPLLVNAIGAYSGTRLVNGRDGSVVSEIAVEADGDWTLVVDNVMTAPSFDGPATGTGDQVFWMMGGSTAATVTHDGSLNFIVEAFGNGAGTTLVVNEIGAYSGTVEMTAPALVQVTADGTWSITPQ